MLRNPVYVKADTDVYNFYLAQGANIVNDVADFIGLNACYLYKGDTKTSKQYDLRDKQLVIAPHQGIVPSSEWVACRIKCLNNRQSALPRKPTGSWLAGKTKCRKCGYALTIRRNKQGRRYFVCTANGSYSTKRCNGPGTIHADHLEQVVLDEISKKLAEIGALTPSDFSHDASISLKINDNKVKISQIDTQTAALIDKVVDADASLMKHINDRVTKLENERAKLLAENISITQSPLAASLPIIQDHVNQWGRLDFAGRKKVADTLIQKIFRQRQF